MAVTNDMIPPELTVDDEPLELDALDVLLDSDDEPADVLLERWAGRDDAEVPPDVLRVVQFAITSDDLAEWAMAHVAQIDAGLAQLDEQRKARIARINRWHERATRRLMQRRGFFAHHLTRYAAAFRARDPKRNKTLHLVNGVVSSREPKPKVVVRNAHTLLAWAVDHMERDDLLAIVKAEVLVSELRSRTKIVRRPAGYEVTLECGHVHHVGPINVATGDPHTSEQLRADGMPCMQCDPDPIDGWPHRSVVDVADWDEPVAVMPAGEKDLAVAGAGIDPGGVTFTVKPS